MAHAAEITASILEAQRAWADLRDIEVCEAGYTASSATNLYRPLTPETRDELSRCPQRPLGEATESKPASLRLLHSREALNCNFFDYWRGRDPAVLGEAIRPGASAASLSFSHTPESGDDPASSRGEPVDVLIEGDDRPTALLTSFTETYDAAPGASSARPTTRPDDAQSPWSELPGCRGLALDLCARPDRFGMLPVARLLEQGAALTRRYGHREFRLVFLWYDVPHAAAKQLRHEIDRFRMRVGGEIDFDAHSFQELFDRLVPHCSEHRGYAEYLSSRYFTPPGP